MTFAITQQILQWPLFRRYGCWQVLTILLAKTDEYGRVSASSEYIESLTGMSHTVVQGVLRAFKEERVINVDEEDAFSIGILPEGVTPPSNSPNGESACRMKESPNTKEKKPMSQGVQRFVKPTVEEVAAYVKLKGFHFDPQYFWDTFEARGWVVGRARTPMKNWHSAANNFEKNELKYNKENTYAKPNNYQQKRDAARQLFVDAEQAVAAQPTQGDVITYGVAAEELGIIPS